MKTLEDVISKINLVLSELSRRSHERFEMDVDFRLSSYVRGNLGACEHRAS